MKGLIKRACIHFSKNSKDPVALGNALVTRVSGSLLVAGGCLSSGTGVGMFRFVRRAMAANAGARYCGRYRTVYPLSVEEELMAWNNGLLIWLATRGVVSVRRVSYNGRCWGSETELSSRIHRISVYFKNRACSLINCSTLIP